ncbi:hypothetical protein TrRE_jg7002, partial [Triparma retinervis]
MNGKEDDPGAWEGIELQEERVVAIRWSGRKLGGVLNGKLLKKLDKLKVLDLHGNSIGGSIPTQLEELEELEELQVQQNQMEGTLTLTKLENLRVCEVLNWDSNQSEGNNFNTVNLPRRFKAQMERHLLRVCAQKLGKDPVEWLEDGQGPDGKTSTPWKGITYWPSYWSSGEVQNRVKGVDWYHCELKGSEIPKEFGEFEML